MITIPQLREGDILEATVNKQEGWMRILEIRQNSVKRVQFIKNGSRTETEITDPEVEEPILFLRADYQAGSLFEALVRTLGVATAIQITTTTSSHGRRAGVIHSNKPGPRDNPKPKKN